jgi:uncharacterized membrane protein
MMMAMYAAVFALAIMGVNDTTYLIRKRLAAAIAVCPIGEDCDKVLTSKQKNILVLPLDIWGLLFYSAVAFSCALAAIGVGPAAFWDSLVGSIVGLGAVLSLFFTYLQWRVIKVWCFWCLTSAFTVWTLGAIIVLSKVIK